MPHEPEELAGIRGRLQFLKQECQTIGQVPPRPQTPRAALGGIFVSFMQRLMFWYAPPLQRTIGGLIQTVEEAVQILGTRLRQETERSAAIEARLQEEVESLRQEIRRLWQETERSTALETRLHQVHGVVDEQIQGLRRQHDELVQTIQQDRASTIDLENNLHEQVDTFQQFQEDRLLREKDLAGELRGANERLQILRREVVEQSRRVAQLLEEARRRLPAPLDREQLGVFEQEALHDLDPLYLSFEDEIRGTPEEIRERLRVYLPFLEQVKAQNPHMTVLDVGCGRGEWLELLRNEGYSARGVDWNRLMVEDCLGRQLSVEQGDALEHLGRVPDASLSVVTVFHMVEHLPFRKLIRLLDEVTRVLQTGGVAILETPNPDNILVGASGFYRDPTHRHPIPSATLRFLVESRGVSQVRVLPLNPSDSCNRVPGDEGNALLQRFNAFFYGPRDYAVVGVKA